MLSTQSELSSQQMPTGRSPVISFLRCQQAEVCSFVSLLQRYSMQIPMSLLAPCVQQTAWPQLPTGREWICKKKALEWIGFPGSTDSTPSLKRDRSVPPGQKLPPRKGLFGFMGLCSGRKPTGKQFSGTHAHTLTQHTRNNHEHCLSQQLVRANSETSIDPKQREKTKRTIAHQRANSTPRRAQQTAPRKTSPIPTALQTACPQAPRHHFCKTPRPNAASAQRLKLCAP